MGGGRNTCVCGSALPADLRWVGYAGPCRVCSRPVVVPPPANYTDPLLASEGSDVTVKALVFEPILLMDWFTRDTGAFYSNEWLVLQSDEKFQIFEIESTLNLLAQRYARLKGGASESRITRRWDVSKSGKKGDEEERRRELDRLERVADLVQRAVDEAQSLDQVKPNPEHGRNRLRDRADQIQRFVERISTFQHLADLFDPAKASVWEGEPRYMGVSRVHDIRALRQIMLGHWQQATEELERAIRCDSEDPVPRQHRMLLSARLGRLDQAESDADWLAERLPEHRPIFTAWRAYLRFSRDRLEEAKSDARALWPGLDGDDLASRMSQLLREHEERAHTLHERWLTQFSIVAGPLHEMPPLERVVPAKNAPDDLLRDALVEAAEMGGGRILMGPSRLGERDFMIVLQPADGAAYWMSFGPESLCQPMMHLARDGQAGAVVRRQFTFQHRKIDFQIDVCVRELEADAQFAEMRVTPLRRGIDSFQPPAGVSRPMRTAVLGFLESGVDDALGERLNSALVRGLTAFNSVPVVRGRTLAYAGVTLNDASEDMGGTLAKIRGEFNAERFVYARLDALPETPDSGLKYSLSLVAGDAWINHAEAMRRYGIYDRNDLESAVELAAQDFARHLRDSDLVPETSTGPEFPPADPKRRATWLKLMAGHHEFRFDRKRAVPLLREAIDLDKGDLQLRTAKGLLQMMDGDLANAEKTLREVADRMDEGTSSGPERARARLRLARVLTAQQDLSGAQQEILSASRFADEDPELAGAVQRSLRYLGLEALEAEDVSRSLFDLGRAIGGEGSVDEALQRHYEGVLRSKVPSRLKSQEDRSRLWLEADLTVGEDLGVRGRTVLRLGRLASEIDGSGDPNYALAGMGWLEWLGAEAPRMYLAGLGGMDAFPKLKENWRETDVTSELAAGLKRVGPKKTPPAVKLFVQEARAEEWTAPHLELVPLPQVIVFADGSVARLEGESYRAGRPGDASFSAMVEEIGELKRAGPGVYVGGSRRGWCDAPVGKFLIERGLSMPLEDSRPWVPPLVRLVFWKSNRTEAEEIPAVLDKWLFAAGEDDPKISPPFITLPAGRRGWRSREAWGEFLPLSFRREPRHYRRSDGVYGVFQIPVL